MIVRPYRSSDRAAVRRICHETGYMGAPAEWFWRDEASFADIFSGWYTDHEPQSAYVVVSGKGEDAPSGTVVGYLLGAVDTSRVQDVASVVLPHASGRLALLRPGTAGVLWRGLWDVAREVAGGRGLPADRFVDPCFPSHFHLDLLPAARGHGAGRELLETWLEQLRAAGSRGCHLETLAENHAAIRFFEQAGFACYGPTRAAPGFRTRDGKPMRILVMVRSLSRAARPAAADRRRPADP